MAIPSQLLKPFATVGAQFVVFSVGANPESKNAMPSEIDFTDQSIFIPTNVEDMISVCHVNTDPISHLDITVGSPTRMFRYVIPRF
jgi:hypothetical protein